MKFIKSLFFISMFFSINNDLMAHSTSRTYFSSLTNAEKSHIRMIQGINGDTNRTHAAYSHIDYSHRLLNKPIFLGKDLSYANFESASLWRPNFINKDLSHANFKLIQSTCPDFYKAILIEACFVQAKATSADFRYTDVQSADFTNANLEDSYFHDIKNLETTIVTEANFKGVKGLTNEQKQFLRDNGALNVSADLIYDCNLEDERIASVVIDHEKIEKKRKSFLKRLFCIKRKKVNAETQT